MGYINLPVGIRLPNNNPLDAERAVVDTISTRDNLITAGRAYDGLQVFVTSERKLYILNDISIPEWGELASADALTSLDMTHNSVILKEFLDILTGDNLGEIKYTLTRNDVPLDNINISFINSSDVSIGVYTTDSSGYVSVSVAPGVYSVSPNIQSGLIVESFANDDDVSTNNAMSGYIMLGVDNLNTSITTLTVNITEPEAPVLYSMTINDGDLVSSNPNLSIELSYAQNPTEYMISDSPTFVGAQWQLFVDNPFSHIHNYVSDMTLTLYVKLKNSKGESSVVNASIDLQNGIVRSDVGTTYNTLRDAITAVEAEYSGNLTQDVTISCIGSTLNTLINMPYDIEIHDFNTNSDFTLTIDGDNFLTYDCDSLGAIKVKNSKNIIFKNLNFINVGSELNHSVPEELAAIMIQGLATAQCDNIVISGCTIDGKESTNYGDNAIIMRYVRNASIIGNTITNFSAIPIYCKNVESISLIKNEISGHQITGIVSQPALVSITQTNFMEISDNILDGTIPGSNGFDTGMILEGAKINIIRNTIHNMRGEALRLTSISPGEYINIFSNIFYDNILEYVYQWVKYQIILSSSFQNVNFENNSVHMRGQGATWAPDVFFKSYDCTIENLKSYSNVFHLDYPTEVNNAGGGTIFEMDKINAINANYNYFIDYTDDGTEMGYNNINVIYDTSDDSGVVLNRVNDRTELNLAGIDQNSLIVSESLPIFSSMLNLTETYATSFIVDPVNFQTYDALYKIHNILNNAGGYYYDASIVSEVDASFGYVIEDLLSGIEYTQDVSIVMNSTDRFILKQTNINRLLIPKISITSPDHTFFSIGRNTINTIYSQLDPSSGLYTGDSIYDINNNGEIYLDRINATQRRTVASFIASDYFPELGGVVDFSNLSIESDENLWTLNDGLTTFDVSTLDASIIIGDVSTLTQILATTNTVTDSSISKNIYPMNEVELEYGNIEVSHEIARVNELVTISIDPLNSVAGTVTYAINIYDASTGTPVLQYTGPPSMDTSFDSRGIYDIEAIITTNGVDVTQRKNMLITITPELQDRIDASTLIVNQLAPEDYFQDYQGWGVPAGTTIVLELAPDASVDAEYRLSMAGFRGTAENPIIVTVDSSSQIQFPTRSYYGLQFYDCEHVVVDGRGYQNLDHGLHITKLDSQDRADVAITVGHLSTNVELFGIEISHVTFAGLQAKTDPYPDFPEAWRANFVMKDFLLHHMIFRDTDAEGIYIGYFNTAWLSGIDASGNTVDYLAHKLEDCKVYRNQFIRNGWDALQANNLSGNSEIAYNTIIDSAIYPETDQATMMSISLSGSLHDNICINSGGIGIQFMPLGHLNVYNNVINGLAYGYPVWLLLNETGTPELQDINDPSTNVSVRMYNNTGICTGDWFAARNAAQIVGVHINNNLAKYAGNLYGGQDSETVAIWDTQSSNNMRITDDGKIYEIADIENNDFNISVLSPLTTAGIILQPTYDVRGYENWNNDSKFVGAYSGYRKPSANLMNLTSVTINTGDNETTSELVSVTLTYQGTPIEYKISELSDVSDATWTSIEEPIPFTLSTGDELKTVYVQLKNAALAESSILSDTITLNSAKTFLLDVGRVGAFAEMDIDLSTGFYWNNITTDLGNPALVDTSSGWMRDKLGNDTSTYTIVTTQFDEMTNNGGFENDATGGIYPELAIEDGFVSPLGTFGVIDVSGLNPSKTHNVKCFGSRSYLTTYVTHYTVNGNTQPLDCEDNLLTSANFNNVDVSNGFMTIKVEGSTASMNGVLSVLEISEN